MMNLFSHFNPISSTSMNMNWMMMIIPISMIMMPYWSMNSMIMMMMKKFINSIIMQFKPSMKKINYPNMITVTTIMLFILYMNTMGMLPSTFSTTSHISMNLSMAMTIWMALMTNKMNKMTKLMSTLTPMNTPIYLIPLMVMIEMISMMIQPMTLSIRLTANVTAGHIMMILISEMYNMSMTTALMMNMMMMLLELAVSLIQAYVFSMLIIMYSK